MRDSILAKIIADTSGFEKTGVIADITAAMHSPGERSKINLQNLPGAFLYFRSESAKEAQDRPGGFTQLVTLGWGVLIVTRSRNDATGNKSAAQVDDLICELDVALCGFTPTDAISAMRKSRNAGKLIKWEKDLSFYTANYEADKRICKQ